MISRGRDQERTGPVRADADRGSQDGADTEMPSGSGAQSSVVDRDRARSGPGERVPPGTGTSTQALTGPTRGPGQSEGESRECGATPLALPDSSAESRKTQRDLTAEESVLPESKFPRVEQTERGSGDSLDDVERVQEIMECQIAEIERILCKGVVDTANALHEREVEVAGPSKQSGRTELEAKLLELEGLARMGVFEEATKSECRQRTGGEPVTGKWVTKERDFVGSGLHKARFVARGFEEPNTGADIFASTSSVSSIRSVLAWAGDRSDRQVVTMDVSQAFLYAPLGQDDEGEVVYVAAPAEYEFKSGSHETMCWRLQRAL